MCSCIWLAPLRLAFFLAICGVGHPLTIIIWFNKVVVVVVVVVIVVGCKQSIRKLKNIFYQRNVVVLHPEVCPTLGFPSAL